MDFHKSRTLTWFSLGMVVAGAIGTVLFVGWLLGEGGRRHNVILLVAPFVLLIGLLGLVATLVPLTLRVDTYGIAVRNKRQRVDLPNPVPWQAFTAVTVEHAPGESDKAPYLVLWPRGPVPGLSHEKAIRRAGDSDAVGIPVVLLSDLKQSTGEVVAALRHYAGPLFDATEERRQPN